MSDHPVILQRNILYSLRHMLRFGLSRANAISKITKEAAEIIGIQNIGQIKPGFKASIAVWNGDPFSLFSHPILVIAEGRLFRMQNAHYAHYFECMKKKVSFFGYIL